MGQKVNPIGLRLGINRTWDSRWYAGKNDYGMLLHEDMEIREELMESLKQAAVSKIVIERPHKKARVTIRSGRLGGAEIARMEWYREGRVPLHTLRADVDYGIATAFTTYGTCGVKVWIFKGEILEHDPMAQDKRLAESDAGRPRRDTA